MVMMMLRIKDRRSARLRRSVWFHFPEYFLDYWPNFSDKVIILHEKYIKLRKSYIDVVCALCAEHVSIFAITGI